MKFEFVSKQTIEADSLEEAKQKFADNSFDFAANANVETESIAIETIEAVIRTRIRRIIHRDCNGDEIDSIILHQNDEPFENETLLKQDRLYLNGEKCFVSDETYNLIEEYVRDFNLDKEKILSKIEVVPF